MKHNLFLLMLMMFFASTIRGQNITQIEYFFDTDPGFGNAIQTSFTASPTINDFTVTASISGLATGIHQLYVRSKDSNGHWSICNRSFFYKVPTISSSNPTINQLEYFFDNDPGYGNATQVTVTPSSNIVDLSIQASLTSLSDEIHQLYVRSKDANGNWSICNRSFFYKVPTISSTNPTINQLEYFFDNDPGYGNANQVTITPSSNIAALNIQASISTLSDGIHQLYVRSKDANGNWSICNRAFFYKLPFSSNTISTITQLEYFFDNDPGNGNATQAIITPSSNIADLSIQASLTTLSDGIHQLYIRSKDANGNWSVCNQSFFYKVATATSSNPSITQLEYFFDNDPGHGNATQVTVTPSSHLVDLNIQASVTSLNVGVHQLYVRSKDIDGDWSICNRMFFYKLPESTNSLADIIAAEYFFDTDLGYGLGVPITLTPGNNLVDLDINTDFSVLPLGPHHLFVRSKDANGNWSITNQMPIEKMQRFDVKLMLQGYYAGSSNMTNTLYNEGQYTTLGDEVDTVTIELHESTYPYGMHSTFKGILKSDGNVIAGAPVTALGSSYYIVIKHRNSVATWSASPILINASTTYDFSTSLSQAYGDNQIEVEPDVFAFFSGDINQDENIDLIDLSLIENDVNNFEFGYFKTDVNGDGNVDLLDMSIPELNSSNFVFSVHP